MISSFYGPIRAQGYDNGTDVTAIMTFYVEHWKRLGCPAPLIEPMCGTGLNMVWYLREGVGCDGLDASGYMLDQCRKRLDDHGFQSRLYEQSLKNLTLEQPYGFMFIPDRSFGHLRQASGDDVSETNVQPFEDGRLVDPGYQATVVYAQLWQRRHGRT
jgi:hypothetical protein